MLARDELLSSTVPGDRTKLMQPLSLSATLLIFTALLVFVVIICHCWALLRGIRYLAARAVPAGSPLLGGAALKYSFPRLSGRQEQADARSLMTRRITTLHNISTVSFSRTRPARPRSRGERDAGILRPVPRRFFSSPDSRS